MDLGYYVGIVLALIFFAVTIIYGIGTRNPWIILFSIAFITLALFLANKYRSSKEPVRMADLNRSILPNLFLILAIFLPFILLILIARNQITLPSGRLFILFLLIPSIFSVLIALYLSKRLYLQNHPTINYFEAIHHGLFVSAGMSRGSLSGAISTSASTDTLTEGNRMSAGDAELFKTIGSSIIALSLFVLLIFAGFIFGRP
jgi:hypothetical protein